MAFFIKTPFPEQPRCPVDLTDEACIVAEECVQKVAEVKVPFLTLILDCFHSAGYVKEEADNGKDIKDLIAEAAMRIAQERGYLADADVEEAGVTGSWFIQVEFDERLNCWTLRIPIHHGKTIVIAIEDCCVFEKTFFPASPHPVQDKVINCGHIKICVSIAVLLEVDEQLKKLFNFEKHLFAPYQLIQDVPGAERMDFVCEELREVEGCRFCCFLETVGNFGFLEDVPMVEFKVPLQILKKVVRIPQRDLKKCPVPRVPCPPKKKVKRKVVTKQFNF